MIASSSAIGRLHRSISKNASKPIIWILAYWYGKSVDIEIKFMASVSNWNHDESW